MKVSVLMVTFNQENFVRQALESVLMQQTDFDFEVVVSDDYSTDGTRDILRNIHAQHPARVRLLLSERHIGIHRNAMQAYAAARGEYFALLDGDDYWTSAHKLQKQIDFLDAHPQCSLCFHNALMVYEDGRQPRSFCLPDQKRISTLDDLLRVNFIPTCSAVYRNRLIGEWPAWMFDLLTIDWALNLLYAQHGSIGYLDETMAVFNKHSQGIWSGASKETQISFTMAFYDRVAGHLGPQYDPIIQVLKSWWTMFYEFEGVCERVNSQEASWRTAERAWVESEARWRDAEQRWMASEANWKEAEAAWQHAKVVYEDRQAELLTRNTALQRIAEGYKEELLVEREKVSADKASVELKALKEALAARVRALAASRIPAGARVLVVSKGDDRWVNLEGRTGLHFPQTAGGVYAGHYPADADEAIAHLEDLRARGADYILFPATSLWWLDHYRAFHQYLDRHFTAVCRDEQCAIYHLDGPSASGALERGRVVDLAPPPTSAESARRQPSDRPGACIWFTGLSGAGKSTTAEAVAELVRDGGRPVTILDGDAVRTHLSKGLGFNKADRDLNVRRIGFVAAEIVRHGGIVICAAVSPYRATRDDVRHMIGDGFVEVYVSTPLEVCEARDVKGMYAQARRGEITNFTGIDDPYEPPDRPEIVLDTVSHTPQQNARRIVEHVMRFTVARQPRLEPITSLGQRGPMAAARRVRI